MLLQGGTEFGLRFRRPAQFLEQQAQFVVTVPQVKAVVRDGGVLVHQLLPLLEAGAVLGLGRRPLSDV
jgi:hypothetical protein